MRRRDFVALFDGAVAWPIAARGQQSNVPVIGFINGSSATAYVANVQFIRELTETDYTVGADEVIE